jgi:hypothetical protein
VSRARRAAARARRARGSAPPFYGGARGTPAERGAAAAMACLADGPWRAWRPGRSGLGRATGSAQSGRTGFSFFEIIFNAKTNSRKV